MHISLNTQNNQKEGKKEKRKAYLSIRPWGIAETDVFEFNLSSQFVWLEPLTGTAIYGARLERKLEVRYISVTVA